MKRDHVTLMKDSTSKLEQQCREYQTTITEQGEKLFEFETKVTQLTNQSESEKKQMEDTERSLRQNLTKKEVSINEV
jgi:hypothetical protein